MTFPVWIVALQGHAVVLRGEMGQSYVQFANKADPVDMAGS